MEKRYFTVTQMRSVKVTASTLLDAAKLASAVFNGETITSGAPDSPGIIRSEVREISFEVTED